jgi:hypothetical protein
MQSSCPSVGPSASIPSHIAYKMASLAEMPQDVLDGILLNVPDFDTLAVVLKTSKELFYTVFQTRSRSIILSVAQNVVGPSLPQALRVAYYNFDGNATTPDEASILNQCTLNRNICDRLQQHAATVRKYEDIFSLK